MTLIGAVITSKFVVQASDRRLTKAGKPFDEQANKSVLVCSHMAYGYSGLAYFGKRRVDNWLVDILKKTKMGAIGKIFDKVMDEARKEIAALALTKKDKRLAILVSGWVQSYKDGPYIPFLSIISNSLDKNWHWKSEADDDFQCNMLRFDKLKEGDLELFWLGQAVPKKIHREAKRVIRKRLKKGGGPGVTVSILVDAIRQVGEQNDMVNKDIMAVSIPLEAVGTNFMQVSMKNQLSESHVASQYFHDGTDEGIRYQPHYLICVGNSFMPITHGKIMTGEAARRAGEMAEFDSLIMRFENAKEEDDMTAILECVIELAKHTKENRKRINDIIETQKKMSEAIEEK